MILHTTIMVVGALVIYLVFARLYPQHRRSFRYLTAVFICSSLVVYQVSACSSAEAKGNPRAKGNPAVCIGRIDCNEVPCDFKVTYHGEDDERVTFVKGDVKSVTYDYDYGKYKITDANWTEVTLKKGTRFVVHRSPEWVESDFANCGCIYVLDTDSRSSRPCRDWGKE